MLLISPLLENLNGFMPSYVIVLLFGKLNFMTLQILESKVIALQGNFQKWQVFFTLHFASSTSINCPTCFRHLQKRYFMFCCWHGKVCIILEIQIKSSANKKNAENFQHQSAYLPRGLKKERNKKSGTQLISISFSLFHDETDNVIDHSKSLGYFLLPSSPHFQKYQGIFQSFLGLLA